MSTIFGIISKTGKAIDEQMAGKMQESLLHTAIDGKNIVLQKEMMFGHHKLIVHRRQTSEQLPFEFDDLIITCDARIDNIEELAKELDVAAFQPATDPLIILMAYKKWGNDCVNHLEGEFTFAIWDKLKRTFYGASDHIGFRTFYYYENTEIFAFASEIKALQSIKTEPPELNPEIFFDYYTHVHRPITYDKNIHVLQSAHYLTLNSHSRLSKKHYWLARKTNKYNFTSSKEWHNCIVKLVTKKIKHQVDSDYPIGILLSGGLDSSFVAAIACKLLKEENKKLIAFSTVLPEGYTGDDKDERFYIEKLRTHYDNLEVHYISVPPEIGPYSNLANAFEAVESTVNIFHYVDSTLYEKARQLNVRTLLTGFGGDMTISHGGDIVIFQYLKQLKLLKAYKLFIKRYKELRRTFYNHIKHEIFANIYLLKTLKRYIKRSDDFRYLPLKKSLLRRVIRKNNAQTFTYNKYYADSINKGELGSLLFRARKLAISFQLEFLSPLLSKEITDLFMDVPGEELMLNGQRRSLIKGAMTGLVPQEIINRIDKLPFSPDHNERTTKISADSIAHLLKDKTLIENSTGINFEFLLKLIQQISHSKIKTELQVNNKLFYIPIIIIAAEFYRWISKNHDATGAPAAPVPTP